MKYFKTQIYLPSHMVRKMREYIEDAVCEFGAKKTYLMGTLIEKAIAQDLLEVYKPASERSSSPSKPKAKAVAPSPAPQPEPPKAEPEEKFAEQKAALMRLMDQLAIAHKAGDVEAERRIVEEGERIRATMVG